MAEAGKDCIRAAPVIAVSDVARSTAYYSQKLGFTIVGAWGEPPRFAIVQRGAMTLMLEGAALRPPPRHRTWAAYIYVADADALFQDLRARGAEVTRAPEDTNYGCRDFDVRDPDGHLLCFGQDLFPGATGPGMY